MSNILIMLMFSVLLGIFYAALLLVMLWIIVVRVLKRVGYSEKVQLQVFISFLLLLSINEFGYYASMIANVLTIAALWWFAFFAKWPIDSIQMQQAPEPDQKMDDTNTSA